MKVSMHFNLPEDEDLFKDATNATAMKLALWDISEKIFRPARKHGYPGNQMSKFLDADGQLKPEFVEVIGILEDLFYGIIDKHEVNL